MRDYQFSSVEGFCIIDGIEIPISKFESTFSVNTIPSASVEVSLGRDMQGSYSKIHDIFHNMRLRLPIKVWLRIKAGRSGILDQWPADFFLAFDGRTTGSAPSRFPNSASVSIGMVHWLDDLTHGSMLWQNSSPRNPYELIFNASMPAAPVALTGIDQASGFVSAERLARDFWKEAMFEWFIYLLSLTQTGIGINLETGEDLGEKEGLPQANKAVEAALRRFEPIVSGNKYDKGKKLAMDIGNVDLSMAANNIAKFLANHNRASLSAHTFWDKILDLSATLMFGVIPLIDRALVVPWTPLLRSVWKYNIPAPFNLGISPRIGMPRILRGIGVFGGRGTDAYSERQGEGPLDMTVPGIGGVFAPFKTGLFEYYQAPMWMAGIDLVYYSMKASGVDNIKGNAQDPGLGNAPTAKTPKEQAINNCGLMTRYATYLYGMEALKSRQGPVNSPLRFDIAPGSIISVGQQGEQFLANDRMADPMVGCVTTVASVVNADNATAMTSFHMSHLRSLQENQVLGTSLVRHPLWNDNWSGSTMSGDFK